MKGAAPLTAATCTTTVLGTAELDAMRDPANEWRGGLTTALTWLRLALVAWAAAVVVVDATGTTTVRVPAAVALLGVIAAWSVLDGVVLTRRPAPSSRVTTWMCSVDVALAVLIMACDHLVYPGAHPQSFGSAWPMSSAVVVGIWWGPRWGGAAGALIGAAGATGTLVFGPGELDGEVLSATATVVLITLAGVIAGLLADLLGRAELRAARADAREEVARHLHDGVLQTLAVVQRRSDDPALVALARDQELDLRRYIAAVDADGPARTGLVEAMRDALVEAERRTGVRGELTVIETVDPVDPTTVEALTAAVGEAVTNAEKHGGASRVVVCLDIDDDGWIECSVNDDGDGFDPATTPEGTGLTRSVRGRIEDLGGQVTVESRPGHGCEVVLRVAPR